MSNSNIKTTSFSAICCNLRMNVLMIAVFSTLHFVVEAAAIFSAREDHRLVLSSDDAVVFAMGSSFILMVVLSCILFFGAFTRNYWCCIPWLVMTCLNILYHVFLMISEIFKMVDDYNPVKLEIFVLMFLSTVILVYCAVVVILFIRDTRIGQQIDSLDYQAEDDDKSPLVSREPTVRSLAQGIRNEPSSNYSNSYKPSRTASANLSKEPSAYSYRAF